MATTTARRTESIETLRKKPGPKPKPFDYTRAKQAFRKPEEFAAWMAGYPNMTGVLAYFYRLAPRIDLSRIGIDATSIHHTTNPEQMTAEFCASRWGRGKYMLKFTDANAKPEQEMARVWFDIDDPDLPPIYDPRTLLLNHPANADEVARLLHIGTLVRDSEFSTPRVRSEADKVIPMVASAAVPVVAPAAAPAGLLSPSLSDQVMLKLLERALPASTPQTANEVLQQSFLIADRFKPVAVPAVSVDEIVSKVFTMLKPAAAPPSDLETWEKMNSFFERLGIGQQKAAAVEGSPAWVGVLTALADRLLTPLVPVAVSFMLSKSRPGPVPVPAARQVAGGAPVAVDSVMPSPLPDAFPAFLPVTAPLMSRIQQVVQLALEKKAAGVAGFRFASWLCGFYPGGADLYRMMERAGGTNAALGMVAMIPELSVTMQDPLQAASLEEWMNDFFTYNADESSDDEPEGDSAAGDVKAAA
jgi:hypothetical protein